MSKLWLYGVFHFNLAFSSIPKSHFSLILDRCYWPVLEVAKRLKVPFGIEATGYTLEILEKYDASYVQALKSAWEAEEIEFIGSSYTQSIFPLCPVAVNQQNLKVGNELYESILGRQPKTAYVNEQTYSSGLVDLYLEAGYEQLFMEWNNPARFNTYAPETRYRPQRILNPDGTKTMTVVWNDSIAFQKLQRLLNQSLSQEDYMAFLQGHLAEGRERAFPFYGSDAEIIDYHPGALQAEYLQSSGAQDLQRLIVVLEKINENPQFGWKSPSQVAQSISVDDAPICLSSPEYPLPCKKQPKYNPTRWAVTGREDTHLNTKCYQRFYQMMVLQSWSQKQADPQLWRHLLEKWGSDFRTHTTEEKMVRLRQTAASLELKLEEQLPQKLAKDPKDALQMVFWNPNGTSYEGPLVLEVQFPHKVLHGYPQVQINPAVQESQIEGIGYYQDGSVRWVKCVLLVSLPPLSETTLQWESSEKRPLAKYQPQISHTKTQCQVETKAVSLKLLLPRGGAIESLQFNLLDHQPWVGTIPHGYFEDIALGADYYSGHFILASKAGEKATDLSPGTLQLPDNLEDYPIRIPVQVGVTTDIGNLWKTMYIYQTLSRVDFLYHFRFRDISAASCRVGMMTILPEAFDPETLAYRTVNGGYKQESFPLKGHAVLHEDPVGVTVSAQHGVGATEGWLAIEDHQNRMILKTYPHEAYAMPMIHYQESDPSYFLRVLPSIGEFDDTSHMLWRGHHQVMFSWMGQKANEPITSFLSPYSLSPHVTILPV